MRNIKNDIIKILFIFMILIMITRYFRIEFISSYSNVNFEQNYGIVIHTRIILRYIILLTQLNSNFAWIFFTMIYAIDGYLCGLYISLKLHNDKYLFPIFIALIYICSPAIFYSSLSGLYVDSLMFDSIVYLCINISLILIESNKINEALYLQLIFVFVKEIISLIIFLYLIINKIKNSKIKYILFIVCIEYITIRLIISYIFPNIKFINPFSAGTINLLFNSGLFNQLGLFQTLYKLFLTLGWYWLCIPLLFLKKNWNILLIFGIYFIFSFLFGLIIESNKLFAIVPILIPVFIQFLENKLKSNYNIIKII